MAFGRIALVFCLPLLCMGVASAGTRPEASKRRFTVADDIGLVQFGYPGYAFSPNGRYFVVDTTRGRLELNRPEDTLRVYRTEDVRQLLSHRGNGPEPLPVWTLSKSTYKDGPIISKTRWLADSSGIAFLAKTTTGNDQLFLADVKTRTVHALTPSQVQVTGFDIRDRNHVVYSILSSAVFEKASDERRSPTVVATGKSIHDLLFPESRLRHWYDLSELWVLENGRRFRIDDKGSGKPIPLYPDPEGQFSELVLSPDGLSVVTTLALETIPSEWETLYPPSYPTHPWKIRAGHQNLQALSGLTYWKEYVLINLPSGRVKPLTNAPEGIFAGWGLAAAAAKWSADGRSIVLPNTFLPPTSGVENKQPTRPCVAVVDLSSNRTSCVVHVSSQTEENWRFVSGVGFAPHSRDRVVIEYSTPNGSGVTSYLRLGNASWSEESATKDPEIQRPLIDISVHQGLNDPPVLVATERATRVSHIIWNPNPQLKTIELGEASVIKWKDKHGHPWSGGLYKPPDFIVDHRYPLVIQTHGFDESEFVPSGLLSTAFAARELAATGIIVLQVKDPDDGCRYETPEEAPCYVDGFEAGVQQLVADGLVDPNHIGIVGFSRSCYHVLQMLTTSALHIQAASITDGVNLGYFQYLVGIDEFNDGVAHEANVMNGGPPVGQGLQHWLKSSPEFNLDKVTAPLQVVGISLESLLSQWEPYAILRYLNKPVDLILLGDGTHVLTNPAQRMMSQGGSLDWFRFWLKDEVDPDPAKAEQYTRWHKMRDGI